MTAVNCSYEKDCFQIDGGDIWIKINEVFFFFNFYKDDLMVRNGGPPKEENLTK